MRPENPNPSMPLEKREAIADRLEKRGEFDLADIIRKGWTGVAAAIIVAERKARVE